MLRFLFYDNTIDWLEYFKIDIDFIEILQNYLVRLFKTLILKKLWKYVICLFKTLILKVKSTQKSKNI